MTVVPDADVRQAATVPAVGATGPGPSRLRVQGRTGYRGRAATR
jgi:hypothetical protein